MHGEWMQLEPSIWDPNIYPPIVNPGDGSLIPCYGCKMTPDTLPYKNPMDNQTGVGNYYGSFTELSSDGNNHLGLYHSTKEPRSAGVQFTWDCVSDTNKLAQSWQEGVAAPLSGNLTPGVEYFGAIDIKKPRYNKDLVLDLQMAGITNLGSFAPAIVGETSSYSIRWDKLGTFSVSDYETYDTADWTGDEDIFRPTFNYDNGQFWENLVDSDRYRFVHNAGLLGAGFTIPHFKPSASAGQELGGGYSAGNPNAWWMAGLDSAQWELLRYGPAEIEIWGGWGNCPGFDDDSSYQNYGPYTSEPSELLWTSGPD
jgi:hypothetical protein